VKPKAQSRRRIQDLHVDPILAPFRCRFPNCGGFAPSCDCGRGDPHPASRYCRTHQVWRKKLLARLSLLSSLPCELMPTDNDARRAAGGFPA
jgi:hypothetical protein